jgi:hypothetical protein
MTYLEKTYPDAYKDCMNHLEQYCDFVERQTKTWLDLQQKDDSLIIPDSVVPPSLSKLKIQSAENYDDEFFESPTVQKVVNQWLQTPSPIWTDSTTLNELARKGLLK